MVSFRSDGALSFYIFKSPSSEELLCCIPSDMILDNLNIPLSWKTWYHAKFNGICYVQDTVHIVVKLKSHLLKPQIVLPLGNFHVSSSHMHALRDFFKKTSMDCAKET